MEQNRPQPRPGHRNIAHDGQFVEVCNIQVAFQDGTLTVDQHLGFGVIAYGVIPENCKVIVMPGRIVIEGRHVRNPIDKGPLRAGFAGCVFIPVQNDLQARLVADYLANHGFPVE